MPNSRSAQPPSAPPVYVRVQQGTTWSEERRFTGTFRIGRDPACDLSITEQVISKVHAEVRCEEGQWWLVDAHSRNGTYLDGPDAPDEVTGFPLVIGLADGLPTRGNVLEMT